MKIATGQGDNYMTDCLLDYNYFSKHYKMKLMDLSKKKPLDADPKVIKQMNFIGNLDRAESATMFFIIKKPKESTFSFTHGSVKVL